MFLFFHLLPLQLLFFQYSFSINNWLSLIIFLEFFDDLLLNFFELFLFYFQLSFLGLHY